MTASEASRQFSAMLDSVEAGETIVLTRGGRRVAEVSPALRADGAALRAVIDRWRGRPAFDDELEARVLAAREAGSGQLDADPWHD